MLRGPIAHCNPTDELEQERLNLAGAHLVHNYVLAKQ